MTHSDQDTKTPDRAVAGAVDTALCPICRSIDIHPSQSLYPMDVARLQGRAGGFWRCRNCGDRFIGAPAPADAHAPAQSTHGHRRPGRGHGHAHHEERRRRHAQDNARWIFPILILLAAIIALVFFLDGRAPR